MLRWVINLSLRLTWINILSIWVGLGQYLQHLDQVNQYLFHMAQLGQ
jgi:hypothetical protein